MPLRFQDQRKLFSYIFPEARAPLMHPLRHITEQVRSTPNRTITLHRIAFLLVAAACSLPLIASAAEPLRLHPVNPHYFEFRGKPTVVVSASEHYGAVLNLDFDYFAYLNTLQADGLNHTRAFTGGEYVEYSHGAKNTLNPASNRFIAPWARSSTPGYRDGGNKFDLDKWDSAYFARLKDFVAQAAARGIIVEITLFSNLYTPEYWKYSPLNASNNVNGVGGIPMESVHTLANGGLLAYQDAMVRKIVTELKDYDNVYYEAGNEIYGEPGTPREWLDHIVDTIANTEIAFPNKHLISLNWSHGSAGSSPPPLVKTPNPKVSIYNFHYSAPPDTVAINYGLNCVIGNNENASYGTADYPYRKEAWEFIIAGGALWVTEDKSFTVDKPDGTELNGWQVGGTPEQRRQLKILKDFIHGFDFLAMSPGNTVIKGGVPPGAAARAIVQAGKQYAIYIAGGRWVSLVLDLVARRSRASLVLELPAGNYRAEWITPWSGVVAKSENFSHPGGNRTLASPSYAEDIALKIRLTGT
ncbi:MAG: glycoside hydrolase family 5 protein [Acidobacteria bacterium]|nr:glycoside hydrolase family 5 protein [Acidobacteriota bacterium]